MIRPTVPADTAALVGLAEQAGRLTAAQVEDLRDRLDAYPDRHAADDHHALTAEEAGAPAGVVYYAPVAMTEGTWAVYWLLFGPPGGEAVGAELLRHAEDGARRRGARLLVAETSSRPAEEAVRRLYTAHGYAAGAVLRDFYADGEDQLIFRKRLAS